MKHSTEQPRDWHPEAASNGTNETLQVTEESQLDKLNQRGAHTYAEIGVKARHAYYALQNRLDKVLAKLSSAAEQTQPWRYRSHIKAAANRLYTIWNRMPVDAPIRDMLKIEEATWLIQHATLHVHLPFPQQAEALVKAARQCIQTS
jgi:hypothetical protein